MIGNISEVIRTLREDAELSQERLAERIGASRSQICVYEKRDICPSVYRFEDIVEACGYELIIRKKGTKE